MLGVPRPSRVCLGGGFSLDFINRCATREITIWCRGRQQMEGRETELSHPTKRWLGGAPGNVNYGANCAQVGLGKYGCGSFAGAATMINSANHLPQGPGIPFVNYPYG